MCVCVCAFLSAAAAFSYRCQLKAIYSCVIKRLDSGDDLTAAIEAVAAAITKNDRDLLTSAERRKKQQKRRWNRRREKMARRNTPGDKRKKKPEDFVINVFIGGSF